MNNATHKQLAAIIALLLSIFVLILFLIVRSTSFGLEIKATSIFIATFLVSFFIINFIFGKFIHERIKLIYKTIYKIKSSTSHIKSIKGDVFKTVNAEVEDWAKENEAQAAEMTAKEEFRREFIGNVSHELKTPIFNIQGYVLTLLEGGLEDQTINRKYLTRVEKSVNRMINLVNDLDTITKLESDQLKLNLKKVNIIELTDEVIESIESFAKENRIKILYDKEYSNPVKVKCDKEKIFQVLTNLLVNSIKYGKVGGKTIIRFFPMDENILVEISDNGIGIESKHLPRLFERFYRVEESRSRDKGGSGLGLAIVKHIIEAHNQTINVRSTPEVGSTFSFTLAKA